MRDMDPFAKLPPDDIKDTSLSGKYRLGWVENSFTPSSITQSGDIMHSGTSHMGTSFSERKLFGLLVGITVVLLVGITRLVYVQILEGESFYVRAEGNRQRIVPIVAERGIIFDRNGIQLTQNVPNFSLAVIPQDLPRNESALSEIIHTLSSITEREVDEISEILYKYRNYRRDSIVITEDIPYDVALKILALSTDLPGIVVHRGSKRLYLTSAKQEILSGIQINELSEDDVKILEEESSANSLSHILGYIGKLSPEELEKYYAKGYLPSDSIGKVGIESSYESYMRGVYGRRRIEVDALGRQQSVLAEQEPISGNHVMLSIDVKIQQELERIIVKHLNEIEKEKASAVVVNPQNGEILAIVSIPGYDNNDFSGGISARAYREYIEDNNLPLFNRAISGTYPSGSVIKPAFAAAALADGIVTPHTTVVSSGGVRVADWFFPDWGFVAHGNTNVRKSIAWSVNTFYYYISGGFGNFQGLGVGRMNYYLDKFGFGKKTGIDIPGEREGFLPTPEWKRQSKGEVWYVGDTYNYSIGQGDFLTTPLQIAMMTASIANRGTLYEPHTVRAIIDPMTGEQQVIPRKSLNDTIVPREHIDTVRLGMRDCVEYGSCRLLSNLPFTSAGKTGTAQWSSVRDTHAWFISFAPYETPEIAITILVEESGEGSAIAAPIAYEFYQWWGEYRK